MGDGAGVDAAGGLDDGGGDELDGVDARERSPADAIGVGVATMVGEQAEHATKAATIAATTCGHAVMG